MRFEKKIDALNNWAFLATKELEKNQTCDDIKAHMFAAYEGLNGMDILPKVILLDGLCQILRLL